MRILLISLFLFSFTVAIPQHLQIEKIEPPNWWSGHTYNELQLMIYGKNLDSLNVYSENDDISITGIVTTNNNNYAFVDIQIADNAVPGEYEIKFFNPFGEVKIHYPLHQRENSGPRHQGFSNEDVVYLIFPDRFVNGDTSNDFLSNENDEFEFKSLNGRHGGDIKGIIDKLDYLKNLGITTIWSTPFMENDMYMSYHGYAATDFYRIDPRHGTNELYKKLVEEAHKRGLKVIFDHVTNHIGINHEWIGNLPTPTWINGVPGNHMPANHDKIPYVDIHRSEKSIEKVNEGWFVDYMPDLNQRDPHLAKYIIQNTLWWIEYSGVDGIREDTYPYANQKFMSEWAEVILEHYPNFNIVGEVWKGEPAILAKFQTNTYFPKEFDSNLPVVTDFAFRDVLFDYLSGKVELRAFYELLGKDFVYSNPCNLLVFFDNHDTDRGMFAANWNLHRYKAALTLTLTTRGIPQLFYGTEIGMDGGGHHGRIRGPFPGGFPGDSLNAFTEEGRTIEQNEIFNFLKHLLFLRNDLSILRTGKLIQYAPEDNLYIYSKSDDDTLILFAINDSEKDKKINIEEFLPSSHSLNSLKDLTTGEIISESTNSEINSSKKSISIYLIQ